MSEPQEVSHDFDLPAVPEMPLRPLEATPYDVVMKHFKPLMEEYWQRPDVEQERLRRKVPVPFVMD